MAGPRCAADVVLKGARARPCRPRRLHVRLERKLACSALKNFSMCGLEASHDDLVQTLATALQELCCKRNVCLLWKARHSHSLACNASKSSVVALYCCEGAVAPSGLHLLRLTGFAAACLQWCCSCDSDEGQHQQAHTVCLPAPAHHWPRPPAGGPDTACSAPDGARWLHRGLAGTAWFDQCLR